MAEQVRGRSPDAAALRERLDGVVRDVGGLLSQFEGLGEAERWDALAAVGELVKCADGAAVRMAGLLSQLPAAADAPGGSPWFGYRSAKEAVRHELGVTAGRAAAIVRVALAATPRRTPTGYLFEPLHPHLAGAIVEGTIGLDQARVIVERLGEGRARVADDDLLAAETSLVADAVAASGGSAAGDEASEGRGFDDTPPAPPELLATVARAWLQAFDPDGAEPREERQIADRSFTYAQCSDGMVRGRFALPPAEGATMLAVLHAYASPRTRIDVDAGRPIDVDDDRTGPQRAADVLAAVFAAHGRSGDAPRPGKESPTLLVAVTLADLEAHAAGEPGLCEIVETGEVVPVQLAARMTCDAVIRTALVDGDGHVLKLGRGKRLFSKAQRLAIMLRDRHCLGCGAPASWNDVHHVRRWVDGGATDIDNGVLVCSRCHHAIHAGLLELIRIGTRWCVQRTVLPPIRRARGARRRAPVLGARERAGASTR